MMCEDVKDLDMFTALQQLLELFETMSKGTVSLNTESLKSLLLHWFGLSLCQVISTAH
ncbi:hypothetical protein GCM10027286_28640 [Virgibacillus ainsalahensis]